MTTKRTWAIAGCGCVALMLVATGVGIAVVAGGSIVAVFLLGGNDASPVVTSPTIALIPPAPPPPVSAETPSSAAEPQSLDGGSGTSAPAAPAEPDPIAAGASGASHSPPVAIVELKGTVEVEGEATVVLIQGSKRYSVPGDVPPGRYEIEASFPGEPAVTMGKVSVSSNEDTLIRCNSRMGLCSGK